MAGATSKNKAAAVITFSADLFCTYSSTTSLEFTATGQEEESQKNVQGTFKEGVGDTLTC